MSETPKHDIADLIQFAENPDGSLSIEPRQFAPLGQRSDVELWAVVQLNTASIGESLDALEELQRRRLPPEHPVARDH